MIKEQELFKMGFRRYGEEEDDPYYKIILKGDVFDINFINGNLKKNGFFEIYSIPNREFKNISEIKELFKINRFNINWNVVKRYGSDILLRDK